IAPAAVSAPVAPIALDPAVIAEDLKQAGLEWVQTAPGQQVLEAAVEPPPVLGRKPRRQTANAVAEPLVMVETRDAEPPASS
ncbi:MAG: hypothetical protein ACO38B_05205, partial [Burkholderiaceae bacterium]